MQNRRDRQGENPFSGFGRTFPKWHRSYHIVSWINRGYLLASDKRWPKMKEMWIGLKKKWNEEKMIKRTSLGGFRLGWSSQNGAFNAWDWTRRFSIATGMVPNEKIRWKRKPHDPHNLLHSERLHRGRWFMHKSGVVGANPTMVDRSFWCSHFLGART